MPSVLIGSGPLRDQPGRFRDILTGAGFDPIDPPGSHQLTPAELVAYLPRADAIVAGGEPITAELLDACPKLRTIARTGVGYDAVDVEAATRRGITVTITPGTNHESVAELAFALLLAVLKRVAINDRIIREGGWDRTLTGPLRGKTLGLVGLGRIGRAMVPIARAFGMTVIGHEVQPPLEDEPALQLRRVGLEELLRTADVVSLHLPLLPGTRGLFDRAAFARMKPGSYILNTARGGVLVEPDLYDALASGHLAGAGLDVLDPEPPDPSNPLMSLTNVVVSPHIAGIDTKAMADMADKAATCIVELASGGWPADCVVNPEVRSTRPA